VLFRSGQVEVGEPPKEPAGDTARSDSPESAETNSEDDEDYADDESEQQFRPGVNAEVLSSKEALPDMNSFSDTFTELPMDAEVSEDEGGESGQSGEDPSMMARAIQTVLKRGEE
jgi:hypothetical protein